jgi:hypothetical protein
MQQERAVEFSLSLHTCNLGSAVRVGTNPFTGQSVSFPIDLGLTAEERDAVMQFITQSGGGEPDPDFFRRVQVADGNSVDVCGCDLNSDIPCSGLAVDCSDLSLPVATFVYGLAIRGNVSIGSSIDSRVVAAVSSKQKNLILHRYPSVALVESPAGIFQWLQEKLSTGSIA